MAADRMRPPGLPSSAAAAGLAVSATVKYNPHLWGPEELRAIFVVRTRELEELTERVRATPAGQVPQHLLVTGSRGMGKTTLLRRLALAVEDDPQLSAQWIAVTFPEEQYTVSTLAELWRNVLDALTDSREREGAAPAELDRLDAEIRRIGELPADEREAATLTSLTDWVKANGRRLLLLIDSTDLLLDNLATGGDAGTRKTRRGAGPRVDGSATPLWRLRNTLSHEPGVYWLGASYQALESEHAYQDAFLDFFEPMELRPLTVAEMRSAMLALARTFGAGRGLTGEAAEREMARILDTRPERLKALRAITGGNPRTTVMLYELFAAGGSDDVHSDLRRLLDTMTPLYKARMESLSDQARKLLAHLMEHWAPVSARILGEISGIATNTVSGQLLRLETEGLIEKAPLRGTRKAGYQAAERLFNVWYLMRYASRRVRQRLGWLVEFMRLWYSADEMTDLARMRAGHHAEGRLCQAEHLEFSRALSLALPDGDADRYNLEWAVFGAARREINRGRAALAEYFELDGEDREYSTAEDYLRRFEALDEGLARCPHLTEESRAEWIEAVKGSFDVPLAEKEALASSTTHLTLKWYQDVLSALHDDTAKWEERYGARPVQVVRKAVLAGNFFPDCPDSKLAHHQILGNFGEDPDAFGLATDLFGLSHKDEWLERVVRHAVARNPEDSGSWTRLGCFLSGQGASERDSEAAFRKALDLKPDIAWAWESLGLFLLRQPGRAEEAEEAFRRAIELNPRADGAWTSLGLLLAASTDRANEAESAYRSAIELNPRATWAWSGLADILAVQPGRTEAAEAAYRHVIELVPEAARPWDKLGRFLATQVGRAHEAEAAYRRAIELDPESTRHWTRLGRFLAKQPGCADRAETAFRRAIELAPDDGQPWNHLGDLLAEQGGRTEEAEAAYRKAIELDPKQHGFWHDLGYLLADQPGRQEEAEAAYRRAIELDPGNCTTWNNLGVLLADALGRSDEAEAAYREAIRVNEADPYPIANLARLLAAAERYPEANAAFRQAVALAQAEDERTSTGDASRDDQRHRDFGHAHLLLQAHLWLGNRDLARQALDRLTEAAAKGNEDAFARIREQARECHAIGLGPALRDLMDASPWADLLQPFALALGAAAAADPAQALAGTPAELRAVAEEVLASLQRTRPGTASDVSQNPSS